MFDLGGVIITLDQSEAIRRMESLGISNAAKLLDPYCQFGIFGDLEKGAISAEDFRKELSVMAGHDLTYDDCRYAWLGYAKELPQRNLDALQALRAKGYRLILLSNTNPYMMSWVESPEFSLSVTPKPESHEEGHPLSYYMDACYKSYEMKMMKPAEEMFRKILMTEKSFPHEILFVDDSPRNVSVASQIGIKTYCPENGADWTQEIYNYL